jgi:GH18 family chitinase
MSYDYAVSDITNSSGMAFSPNAPLYTPSDPRAVQMSVNYTVYNYLSVGVPPSKIMIGFPLYAHTFFNPTLNATNWKGFGGPTYVQGACCGPFGQTYGGKPGKYAQQCGTMMYSEVMEALGSDTSPQSYFDEETQSNVAYFSAPGADDSTPQGTWVSYNDEKSAVSFAKYAKSMGLGGVFIFDASMDTREAGQWTYQLSTALATELAAP